MEQEIRALIRALSPGLPVNYGINPEGTPYPAAVLNLVSSVNGHHQEGPDSLRRARLQVDVYATQYADLVRVRDDIRSVLDGYRSETIEGAFLDNISQTASEGKHRAMMTFFVSHAA